MKSPLYVSLLVLLLVQTGNAWLRETTGVDSLCSRPPLFTHVGYGHAGFRGPLTYCRREYQSLRWFRRVARRFFFSRRFPPRCSLASLAKKIIIIITSGIHGRLWPETCWHFEALLWHDNPSFSVNLIIFRNRITAWHYIKFPHTL